MGEPRWDPKPIRVFYSALTKRFYATALYREELPGITIITGKKFDVTNDIAAAIIEHDLEFTADLGTSPKDGL